MRFEWDPTKAARNARKHGVTFEEAVECFEDPFALVLDEAREPDRFILIGATRRSKLLFTVYVHRTPAVIRIVSARKATRKDQLKYEEAQREMPEVEFAQYRLRRNPFAARIAREGIEILRDEPTPESLAEIPEADLTKYRVRRNPYVSRAGEAVARLQYGRGRPAKERESGPTRVRSLRLPDAVWKLLDEEAKRRHTTTHALLRELVAMFVDGLGD